MNQTEIAFRDLLGNSIGMYALYVAIGIAVVFLGLVVYDHFRGRKRRKHNRRFQPPAMSFRQKLARPFALTGEVFQALRQAAHRRARQKDRAERAQRQAEQMRRGRK